jgi:hypothetical protein
MSKGGWKQRITYELKEFLIVFMFLTPLFFAFAVQLTSRMERHYLTRWCCRKVFCSENACCWASVMKTDDDRFDYLQSFLFGLLVAALHGLEDVSGDVLRIRSLLRFPCTARVLGDGQLFDGA